MRTTIVATHEDGSTMVVHTWAESLERTLNLLRDCGYVSFVEGN